MRPANTPGEPPSRKNREAGLWTRCLIGETLSYVVIVLPVCRRELEAFPQNVRGDLADAVARLDAGLMLSMPLSRPMPSIGRGVHELRLKDRSGIYRVVYALIRRDVVYVFHAFKKTTQRTPQRHVELARQRLKEVMR